MADNLRDDPEFAKSLSDSAFLYKVADTWAAKGSSGYVRLVDIAMRVSLQEATYARGRQAADTGDRAYYAPGDPAYEHTKVMRAVLSHEGFRGAMVYLITKYLWRSAKPGKDPRERATKAAWYAARLKEVEAEGDPAAKP